MKVAKRRLIEKMSLERCFTSQPAWVAVQSECPDLRRTHAHLVQGTRPSKKLTNIKDVKIIDKLHQLQMMASLL